jgi:hypothetical protein
MIPNTVDTTTLVDKLLSELVEVDADLEGISFAKWGAFADRIALLTPRRRAVRVSRSFKMFEFTSLRKACRRLGFKLALRRLPGETYFFRGDDLTPLEMERFKEKIIQYRDKNRRRMSYFKQTMLDSPETVDTRLDTLDDVLTI